MGVKQLQIERYQRSLFSLYTGSLLGYKPPFPLLLPRSAPVCFISLSYREIITFLNFSHQHNVNYHKHKLSNAVIVCNIRIGKSVFMYFNFLTPKTM